MYKKYYGNNLSLVISDFLMTLITLSVIAILRPYLPGEELAASEVIPHWSMYLLGPLSLTIVLAITGAYDFRRIPKLGNQVKRLLFSYAIWGWIVVGALYFSFRQTSRLLVVYFALTNLGLLVICRYLIWKCLASLEKVAAARVVIFGPIESSTKICDLVLKGLPVGYDLVGLSDFTEPATTACGARFLGTADALPEIVRSQNIDIVIISLDQTTLASANQLIVDLIRIPVRVLLTQDYSSLPFLALEIERLGSLVLVGILEPVITGWSRLLKRFFDLVLCSIGLLLTWPIFLMVAIAIKLESRGSAIFRTTRIGNGGKPFTMYKFRSMVDGASEISQDGPAINANSHQVYKHKDDPRTTRVGKFIRRWSLDELPQLFNVLKGEMSLVGPRPEQPHITEQYQPWQWQRIQVPPGLTGWWQVHGRSEFPLHLNTHMDIYYVANYSMLLDLKILFLTIIEVIKGRGAY